MYFNKQAQTSWRASVVIFQEKVSYAAYTRVEALTKIYELALV